MCAERAAALSGGGGGGGGGGGTRRARGFSLVEALVALVVVGGAAAAVLPTLARALAAKAEREAGVPSVLLAQSLLEAHAPPGAARPGRWEGATPEGSWRVEIGEGEEGPRGAVLRPVRVAVGGLLLDSLRPGPVEPRS
jgi:prepilin-type N-terminal cleavage/methylation domain-containing protein